MINNIGNFFKSQNIANKAKGETELSVFYLNDVHGDIRRASKMQTAKDCFEKQNTNNNTLSLAAGDLFYGDDHKRTNVITKFLNALNLDAIALGNHDFHAGSEALSERLKGLETKAVCANVEIPKGNKLNERIADKKLVKSAVFMRGGHKFAVIGASPFDTDITIKEKKDGTGIKQMDVDKTIKAINEEAKKLEEQGINKIILCSHTGYGEHADLKIARETEGIDIIVGGHSHTTIEGANTKDNGGNNKLNVVKSKRGETVVITQADKLNKKAGFLNVVFDKNGVIKEDSIVNKLADVDKFEQNSEFDEAIVETLGKNRTLATPKNIYMPINEFQDRYMENPVANAISDAILAGARKVDKEVLAEVHTTNNLKKGVEGSISLYDVKYDMLPYNDQYHIVEMTEEDFIKTMEATSGTVFEAFDPELLRCSGMKYTIDENIDETSKGHIKDVQFVDENNNVKRVIDVKNPSKTDKVKIVLNSYLFIADKTKDVLSKYKDNSVIVGGEQDLFVNYLEENPNIDFSQKSEKRIDIKYNNLDKLCYQYSREEKEEALKTQK